ncbi:MAG: radical SAM protein [Rhodothermales bacterium]|nr:radical SAM protein [Rhodothermales bacterium]
MRPILANYYVTYRCNATCSFCDIWEQPSPMVDVKDVERNLRDMRELGVRVVDFTGGEPLLHTDLPEMLAIAKGHGLATSVTTNGLLYPKRAKKLAGLVDLLHFSIDSAEPEMHNASRGVDCFDKLMESIDTALSLGERPDLLFTVTNENVDQMEKIYETISFPNRLVLILNPLFEYASLGDSLSRDVMDRMDAMNRRPLTYLNPSFLDLRRKGGNDPENPVCKAVSTCIVISPFNELVLPCYHYGLEKIPIGDSLKDVWNSDRVSFHRQWEGRHDVCKGCSINCYFEPSFAVSPMSKYFWKSIPSKVGYGWTKYITQKYLDKVPREAVLPLRPEVGTNGDQSGMYELPVIQHNPISR